MNIDRGIMIKMLEFCKYLYIYKKTEVKRIEINQVKLLFRCTIILCNITLLMSGDYLGGRKALGSAFFVFRR